MQISEMRHLCELLSRSPNEIEEAIVELLWSEHCSYKSSKYYLKSLHCDADYVVQSRGENAGVIEICDDLCLAMKVESHNHPSAVEPYNGAATGVGGIVRDILVVGARPIALANSLKFGPLSNPLSRYHLEGVVEGIAGYGNTIGVPTVAGETYFDCTYLKNPIVNVLCIGLTKKDKVLSNAFSQVGNLVVYAGAFTGRDGIAGACFASAKFDSVGAVDMRGAVQVADPFTGKLLIEAFCEAHECGLIDAAQDLGGGGLAVALMEVAAKGNCGLDISLDRVPMRDTTLTPKELLTSESQERLLFSVKRENLKCLQSIFQKWNLCAVEIGQIDATYQVKIKFHNEIIATLPTTVVKHAPLYKRRLQQPQLTYNIISDYTCSDYNAAVRMLLSRENVISKQWIFQQYDHMVGLNTVLLPGYGGGSVLRIKGTDVYIGLTLDSSGRFFRVAPRFASALVCFEAARNLACMGTTPRAITNCLNFTSPENPHCMWQFREAIEGLSLASRALNIPIISGNVSFYNETEGVGITPAVVVGMVGVAKNWQRNEDKIEEGTEIFLVGKLEGSLVCSEYLQMYEVDGSNLSLPEGSCIPTLDIDYELKLIRFLTEGRGKGIIAMALDICEGGLVGSLVESCMINNKGLVICIPSRVENLVNFLFGEWMPRCIVFCSAVNEFYKLAKKFNIDIYKLGQVMGERLIISSTANDTIINLPLDELSQLYRSLGSVFGG